MRTPVSPRGILFANQARFWVLVAIVTTGALLAALTAAPEAYGQRGPEVPSVNKKMVVGTKEAPPFSMKDLDGQWTGISIDLWRQIAAELNLSYEFRELDQYDLLEGLTNGSLDVVVTEFTITPERLDKFDFTYPFYTTGLGLAVVAKERSALVSIIIELFSLTVLKISVLILLAIL